MVRNNNFFILSGFISVSLFIFFFLIFIYMLFSSNNIKSFALKKDNYISVSLDFSIPEIQTYTKNIKTDIKTQDIVSIPQQEVDVQNLFSDVWTKKIDIKKPKKKKIDIKRIQEIERRVKTLQNNDVKNISEIVKTTDTKATQNKKSSLSTSNEVNEYLAKIQALVYEHFFPPQNSQGYSVKAVIELSAIGKVMDFRILNYSANSSLNDECDKVKNRLMGIVFPVNPEKKTGNYIIILTAKE